MMTAKSRQISLRLSEEEVALLPECANASDAVRLLMTKGAKVHEVETIVDNKMEALRRALSTILDETLRSAVDELERRDRVALEMILYNLRALYSGMLRTEAVATAALYGIVDQDVTGNELEEHLKTRFEEHMSRLWPLFVEENERGLRSLRGAASAAEHGVTATENNAARTQSDDDGEQEGTPADAAAAQADAPA